MHLKPGPSYRQKVPALFRLRQDRAGITIVAGTRAYFPSFVKAVTTSVASNVVCGEGISGLVSSVAG